MTNEQSRNVSRETHTVTTDHVREPINDPTQYWMDKALRLEAEVERLRAEYEQLLRAQLRHEHEMREYCRYQREAVAEADAMRPVVEAARAWAADGYRDSTGIRLALLGYVR